MVVALTTLAHVALLAGLARVVPPEPPPEPPSKPDIKVELTQAFPITTAAASLEMHRPLGLERNGQGVEGAVSTAAREHLHTQFHHATPPPPAPQARTPARPPSPRLVAPRLVAPRLVAPRSASPRSASSRPGPTSATQPAAGPTAGVLGAAPSPGANQAAGPEAFAQGDVRSTLRTTVGCTHADYLHLTPAEREACARQFGRQASIGARQWIDPLSSAAERAALDRERDRCQSLHHYATPLDEDANHSAKPPGMWGPGALGC